MAQKSFFAGPLFTHAYGLFVRLSICVFVLAGILNLANLDFCGGHQAPAAIICSFAAYAMIAAITETEIFLFKDATRLWVCLVFWAVHSAILLITLVFVTVGFGETVGLGLTLMIISPCIGIDTLIPGLVFPAFCLIELAQTAIALRWDKNVKQD